jgi:hypothetical protein
MPEVHPTATVYPGTVLGEGVRVLENAVVGKQPALGPKSTARQRVALRRRPRSESRLLPDNRILEHAHALAEHRARIDRRGGMNLSHEASR